VHHFHYLNGHLHAEDVSLAQIAQRHGTPTYVYSRATLERHFHIVDGAFAAHPHTVCYSVKANPLLGILRLLGQLGSGADVVSGGELHRVLKVGIAAGRVVFSGVGKTEREMEEALSAGIRSFHVESEGEIDVLAAAARRLGRRAPVSLRVNPDVDAATHPYIATGLRSNKFGVPVSQAARLYAHMAKHPYLQIHGVASHIGSQITTLPPIAQAAERLVRLAVDLRAQGYPIDEVDFGGGLGIPYMDENPPSPLEYARALLGAVGQTGFPVVVEPGRVIVGNAGVLIGRVLYVKETEHKTFVITDIGMNDAIRPALYGAHHAIQPVMEAHRTHPCRVVDVVGPVCESADFIAKDRELPLPRPGDLLCMMGAGAYSSTMSSNYNSRPRAAEVLVDGASAHLLRRRETYEDLMTLEQDGDVHHPHHEDTP
jgi:diaminopimelate decarboxylase